MGMAGRPLSTATYTKEIGPMIKLKGRVSIALPTEAITKEISKIICSKAMDPNIGTMGQLMRENIGMA